MCVCTFKFFQMRPEAAQHHENYSVPEINHPKLEALERPQHFAYDYSSPHSEEQKIDLCAPSRLLVSSTLKLYLSNC